MSSMGFRIVGLPAFQLAGFVLVIDFLEGGVDGTAKVLDPGQHVMTGVLLLDVLKKDQCAIQMMSGLPVFHERQFKLEQPCPAQPGFIYILMPMPSMSCVNMTLADQRLISRFFIHAEFIAVSEYDQLRHINLQRLQGIANCSPEF